MYCPHLPQQELEEFFKKQIVYTNNYAREFVEGIVSVENNDVTWEIIYYAVSLHTPIESPLVFPRDIFTHNQEINQMKTRQIVISKKVAEQIKCFSYQTESERKNYKTRAGWNGCKSIY